MEALPRQPPPIIARAVIIAEVIIQAVIIAEVIIQAVIIRAGIIAEVIIRAVIRTRAEAVPRIAPKPRFIPIAL